MMTRLAIIGPNQDFTRSGPRVLLPISDRSRSPAPQARAKASPMSRNREREGPNTIAIQNIGASVKTKSQPLHFTQHNPVELFVLSRERPSQDAINCGFTNRIPLRGAFNLYQADKGEGVFRGPKSVVSRHISARQGLRKSALLIGHESLNC